MESISLVPPHAEGSVEFSGADTKVGSDNAYSDLVLVCELGSLPVLHSTQYLGFFEAIAPLLILGPDREVVFTDGHPTAVGALVRVPDRGSGDCTCAFHWDGQQQGDEKRPSKRAGP